MERRRRPRLMRKARVKTPKRRLTLLLRWCPQCGRVEIDTEHRLKPIRAGNPGCALEADQWHRGTLAECNEYFAGTFRHIATAAVKTRWHLHRHHHHHHRHHLCRPALGKALGSRRRQVPLIQWTSATQRRHRLPAARQLPPQWSRRQMSELQRARRGYRDLTAAAMPVSPGASGLPGSATSPC
jgi:hypothetical protein